MAAPKGHRYQAKYDEKEIKKLCDSILIFAEKERSAHFATWARKQKKTPSWINGLAKNYPVFKQAYEDAKELMASKLLNSSIYQDDEKFNATHAMTYLPVYDKNFREYLEWKAKLTQQSSESIKTTFAEMKNAIKDGSFIEMLKQDDD